MPYSFDNADTLIYSDDPEALKVVNDGTVKAVHVATPKNAILYVADVGEGVKRVFYYHQNFDSDARAFGIRLVNLGGASVDLSYIVYSQSPSAQVLDVGHRSVVGFLQALIADNWTNLTLPQNGDAVIGTSVANSGELASTFLELRVQAGAQLKIQVVSADQTANIRQVGTSGPTASNDGFGRSGIFDLTRGGTSQGDFQNLEWSTGEAALRVTVPTPPFPNAKPAPVNPPRTQPPTGTFGIFTRRTVALTNPTANSVDVGVYVQANGGQTPATCMLNADIIELGTMTSGAQATRPGYQIGQFTIDANDAFPVLFDVLATVDPSGSGPLDIVIGPPNSVLAPPPGQIVFRPGGPPWTAS